MNHNPFKRVWRRNGDNTRKNEMTEYSNRDIAGMLSDNDIRQFWGKGIDIQTTEKGDLAFSLDKQLKYGSIDLHFRHEYKKVILEQDETLTYNMLETHGYTIPYELSSDKKLRIKPGEMILTTTIETVHLSEEFAGIVTGRSSIARLGIMVHCCQEFINPGHGQTIPLQIINLAPCSVELDLRIPICQLIIFKLRTPASGRYKTDENSKYADEIGPQQSQIHKDLHESEVDVSELVSKVDDYNKVDNKEEQMNKRGWIKTARKIVITYLESFLPAVIMLLFVTPFLTNVASNTSASDILAAIRNMPLSILLGLITLILYVWIKKGE